MANTGYKGWNTLEKYNVETGEALGETKANISSDPDYVAPVYDTTTCPITLNLTISPSSTNIDKDPNGVNINVTSNTDWVITNLSSYMSTPFGSTGTGNGTAHVSFTANGTTSTRYHNFNIRTSDDSIIRTVTVKQTGESTSTTTYPHQLGYGSTSSTACSDAGSGYTAQFYTDSSTFYSSTKIYTNSSGTNLASATTYSNNAEWISFNGVSVTSKGLCGKELGGQK